MIKIRKICLIGMAILVLTAVSFSAPQARRQQPPEYREIVAATRMDDAESRLKEMERIKATYPDSQMMATIDNIIIEARIEMASSLGEVLGFQKTAIDAAQGPGQLTVYLQSAAQILEHPKMATFDKGEVLEAVLGYREMAKKASENPGLLESVRDDQKEMILLFYVTGMEIPAAQAYLNAGDPGKAMTALQAYKASGGAANLDYNFFLGEASAALGRNKEAYSAFMNAAVEPSRSDRDEKAAEKARALYIEMNGNVDGFEAELEEKAKALPYHAEKYEAPSGWQGKAVLAELFTGSECPPCVGADMGFDGLIEAYPQKYLVILEYHLPIPRPDPMMNPATKLRQDFYGVNSTPTVIIGGTEKLVGGGSRGMAESKFAQYKKAIDPMIDGAPGLNLQVKASLVDDSVEVSYDFDKVVPGADYHVVLVQDEQEYQGSNGLKHHKMVVRDLVTIDTSGGKKARFDLAASEKATDAYMTEFAKTYTRIPNFQWTVRHNTIARKGLKVVFFAQDRESKAVLNAVMTDIE